ncbi:bifunctional 3-(3-hydroxy-phenyl)propionate/3-hydroxycinnamic acid hydroxylase [Mesobacillus maritimus]|uniref:bifunctional 3-(3-hydroxy-phenyl)propionate/3-hydroxycinnamic acid hydroxylase MhpA n=1 Tax=Mesobacillus maritimus TaxID=1643336 RepID=UPI00203DD262|nr:bifunctional 3-(3-hydroxy-phenyl)propionate/3-hydroxycinnamic acid hydroxylase [Mesobacillus maritimus]MCM3584792.1 bifunctional 3-(3-hydroxy-phenyl)propionate/3-hydroxycinnamic acid hydroxylase [Mesobacillus maritimus]MCM3671205.1 bifunctional 3-(3-hydroxy-phenyl)propionate/3-hydroxycinnamic acid hydroxylase [Mesobacillus maritimus]
MNQERVDVAIVGYGPVAKLLATLLGQKGWKVGVYERFPKAYVLPRAVTFDDEIARILQSILPVSEIEKVTVPVPDDYLWVNAKRETLLALDFSQFGVSGWPGRLFFNQPQLEEVMDVACRQQPTVKVHLGCEAVGLKEFDDHVELIVKDENDEETEIFAKYVIGCDGANSFVRQNMEHTITDLGFVADWLVVDIIPQEEREWNPMNLQVCDPARPTTVVSGGPGRRRWEFMALPGETKEALNKEEVAWKLLEPWDITPSNSILERHAVYTFKGLWVDEWQKGRLMVAGDAAHLTPPFMGQGLCSGLRDSMNLAWKLDLVLNGKAEEKILETYTEERKPHNQTLVEAALYLGKMICITDPEAAAKRDEDFFSGSVPPFPDFPHLTEGVFCENEKGLSTGKLSFQSQVMYQGETGLFDDVVGRGWMVIGFEEDPKKSLSQEQIDFVKNLGGQFMTVSSTPSLEADHVFDVEGKYQQYFKETGFEVVVVRPDFYLYGGCASIADLSVVVDDLVKQLGTYLNTATAG